MVTLLLLLVSADCFAFSKRINFARTVRILHFEMQHQFKLPPKCLVCSISFVNIKIEFPMRIHRKATGVYDDIIPQQGVIK